MTTMTSVREGASGIRWCSSHSAGVGPQCISADGGQAPGMSPGLHVWAQGDAEWLKRSSGQLQQMGTWVKSPEDHWKQLHRVTRVVPEDW